MKDFLKKVNSYIKEAYSAGKYLYDGFSVTFDHLRRRPVTVQYPYETVSYTHLTLPTNREV